MQMSKQIHNSCDVHLFSIDFSELTIHRSDVESAMGYESGGAPEPVPELIDIVLSQIAAHSSIQGGFVLLDDIRVDDNGLTVHSCSFEMGKTIANALRRSQSLAAFVCTAGAAVTEWSKSLSGSGEILESYVVDTVGSECVEKSMDFIQDSIRSTMAEKGLNISNRFSPGYCGWPVHDQKKLFSLFPEQFCGVSLSASSLMSPIKSISGVIGLGKDVRFREYSCGLCTMTDCFRRKTIVRGTGLEKSFTENECQHP